MEAKLLVRNRNLDFLRRKVFVFADLLLIFILADSGALVFFGSPFISILVSSPLKDPNFGNSLLVPHPIGLDFVGSFASRFGKLRLHPRLG